MINKQSQAVMKSRKNNMEHFLEYQREWRARPETMIKRKEFEKTEIYKEVNRKSSKKYRDNNPKKCRAHGMVGHRVKNGTIKKLPCSICGDLKSYAHHEDYDKPLEIIWLCKQHHEDRHVEIRRMK